MKRLVVMALVHFFLISTAAGGMNLAQNNELNLKYENIKNLNFKKKTYSQKLFKVLNENYIEDAKFEKNLLMGKLILKN